ncbi:MAG: hypothetical protein Tsb0019_03280 [Roseibium sp.]
MDNTNETEFVGHSPRNDFNEALTNAIAQARRVLGTTYVMWELAEVYGETGGFVGASELYVRISVGRKGLASAAGPAFFEMLDVEDNSFVIKLWDPETIAHARRIVSGDETGAIHVMGKVVDSRVAYNPQWDYHLDPTSISFFENAVEVCDATIRYVEDHLSEVGGAFLPGAIWCPWTSKLVRELSGEEMGS